ncbi:MAG: WecB/TagA/CpsF family glycosyltransferase [Planctomycetes bacterium]|nr:WecB/TagA/CpsF family glycosyltransferase [Planctomycetota bacterium]
MPSGESDPRSPPPPAPPKVSVLGIGISATSYADTLDCIGRWIVARTPAYVAICTVHSVMEGVDHPAFGNVLNAAHIATPDGVPLVWALRLLGQPKQTRVYGPDLLLHFCERAAHTGWSSYFYGGGDGVAGELAATLTRRFTGLRVCGWESPPFRALTPAEDDAVVARINASGADVVWVGLGAPKQEQWMARHQGRVRAVMVGVGAAFDFHTGRVRQAPRWMMRLGLEWFFRLLMEPRRLWRRYAYHNPRFVARLLAQVAGRWFLGAGARRETATPGGRTPP